MGGPALIDGRRVAHTDNNYWHAPFVLEGQRWLSCEQFFQWSKFTDITDAYTARHRRAIAAPMKRNWYSMGQSRRARLRPDWEKVKDDVMYRAVKAKYEQNPQIAAELMQTQGGIEAAPGEHWHAENRRILERVRRELREAAAPVAGSGLCGGSERRGAASGFPVADGRATGELTWVRGRGRGRGRGGRGLVPPAGYVPGIGRGAVGFTTRSDIGPMRIGPSIGPALKRRRVASAKPPGNFGVNSAQKK